MPTRILHSWTQFSKVLRRWDSNNHCENVFVSFVSKIKVNGSIYKEKIWKHSSSDMPNRIYFVNVFFRNSSAVYKQQRSPRIMSSGDDFHWTKSRRLTNVEQSAVNIVNNLKPERLYRWNKRKGDQRVFKKDIIVIVAE